MTVDKECVECGLEYKITIDEEVALEEELCFCPCCGCDEYEHDDDEEELQE